MHRDSIFADDSVSSSPVRSPRREPGKYVVAGGPSLEVVVVDHDVLQAQSSRGEPPVDTCLPVAGTHEVRDLRSVEAEKRRECSGHAVAVSTELGLVSEAPIATSKGTPLHGLVPVVIGGGRGGTIGFSQRHRSSAGTS